MLCSLPTTTYRFCESIVIPAKTRAGTSGLVIPAKAGIHVIDLQVRWHRKVGRQQVDSRFRGNDEMTLSTAPPKHPYGTCCRDSRESSCRSRYHSRP